MLIECWVGPLLLSKLNAVGTEWLDLLVVFRAADELLNRI
jgi:hypothetical protein